jgi:carbon storage regulator
MLVLSRKVNENIIIDGRIVVKVVRTEGNFVKLGIEAPPDVPVHRQEVYDEIQRNNQAALTSGRPAAARSVAGPARAPAGTAPAPIIPGASSPAAPIPAAVPIVPAVPTVPAAAAAPTTRTVPIAQTKTPGGSA